jgi:hypothetical protein
MTCLRAYADSVVPRNKAPDTTASVFQIRHPPVACETELFTFIMERYITFYSTPLVSSAL